MTKGLRILLVEDHDNTRQVMSRLLRGFQHDVKAAENMQAALDLAGSHDFDLVISDLGLPDGSGVELMEALKARYGLSGIALTGYGDDEEINKAREAGFVTHLLKPIAVDKLQEAIGRFGQG